MVKFEQIYFRVRKVVLRCFYLCGLDKNSLSIDNIATLYVLKLIYARWPSRLAQARAPNAPWKWITPDQVARVYLAGMLEYTMLHALLLAEHPVVLVSQSRATLSALAPACEHMTD